MDLQGLGTVLGRGERDRIAGGVGEHDDRRAGPGEEGGEAVVPSGDAVGDEHDLAGLRLGERGLERGGEGGAVGRPRLGPERGEPFAGDLDARRREILVRAVGGGGEDDRSGVPLGAVEHGRGGAGALGPIAAGSPAVVDDEGERTRPGGDPRIRPPQRAGEGDDHRGGEEKAQERQPPRARRRRLLLAGDFGEQAGRREGDLPRPRRRQPQQPPDRRQQGERGEDRRRREGEGQPNHGVAPLVPAPARQARSASRAPDAGLSV